jgi:hypothetical protein
VIVLACFSHAKADDVCVVTVPCEYKESRLFTKSDMQGRQLINYLEVDCQTQKYIVRTAKLDIQHGFWHYKLPDLITFTIGEKAELNCEM